MRHAGEDSVRSARTSRGKPPPPASASHPRRFSWLQPRVLSTITVQADSRTIRASIRIDAADGLRRRFTLSRVSREFERLRGLSPRPRVDRPETCRSGEPLRAARCGRQTGNGIGRPSPRQLTELPHVVHISLEMPFPAPSSSSWERQVSGRDPWVRQSTARAGY